MGTLRKLPTLPLSATGTLAVGGRLAVDIYANCPFVYVKIAEIYSPLNF